MKIYYNEIEPSAIVWLQAAMDVEIISRGDIDTRSIEDVTPNDVLGYDRCHYFAGIGGWEIAIKIAESSGWKQRGVLWTGSCPCQPFSTAGKGLGNNDPRHLWPSWFWLIQQCKPDQIYGEQVANAIAHGWWDDVASDLEAEGYACGASIIPACGVGAPHKRERLWFVGNSEHYGQPTSTLSGGDAPLANNGWEEESLSALEFAGAGTSRDVSEHVAYTSQQGLERHGQYEQEYGEERRQEQDGYVGEADLQWLDCPDGKQRPVKSSFGSMVNGVQYRAFRVLSDQNGELDATTTKADNLKKLQVLWERVFPQAIQWPIRGLRCLPETGTLQFVMRQFEGSNKTEELPSASKEAQERFLRELPEQPESSRPPYRQRYYQQRSAQLADFMCYLSSQASLGYGRQKKNEAQETLHCLFTIGKEAGLLSKALPESQETWVSVPYETQGVLWNVFSRSIGLDFHHIPLLVDGLPSRLRKAALHGFGNAIVPAVAAEFIKSTGEYK